MKDKNSVGNSDSKQKKRGARKSVFLLTLFALLFVLPVIISFVLLFFLSEDSKGVIVLQPLSMLIPAASVIFGGGIALFICGIAYKKRCKELVKCTEELFDGSFQPADHECRDRDELKATAGIEKISQQLAELRDGNAVISEKCSDLQNECDGLRFSLLTAKSGPMLFTRAMEKLNKLAAKGENIDEAFSAIMDRYNSIIKEIWGYNDIGSTKKLQVNMANIRKKLGDKPGKNNYIANELGVGYRMNDKKNEITM